MSVDATRLFDFRARDATGAEHRGQRPGATAAAVARELSGQGWTPLEVVARSGPRGRSPGAASTSASTPAASAGAWLAGLQGAFVRLMKPSEAKAQAALSRAMRELAALLRAGLPLMSALQLVAGSDANPQVREPLQRIGRDLDAGRGLVEAAEREHRESGLITLYDLAMLRVGEETGRLPEAFLDLHHHREFVRTTQDQVKAALRYPAFVIFTCLLAAVVVNLWVIPSFAKVFAQARTELPLLTQVLLGTSRVLLQTWPFLLVAVVGAVVGVRRWLATPAGRLRWDRARLRLPIVGPIMQGIVLARMCSSLASSLKAGLTVSNALAVTARTLGNTWFEQRLEGMGDDLARGTSITSAARNMGVLPPSVLQLFAIGEKSGSLEELLREVGVHYREEVDVGIKGLAAAIEPLMVWLLGGGVLLLALGIFMPMWDLGRAVTQ